jgi:hypothetical protein
MFDVGQIGFGDEQDRWEGEQTGFDGQCWGDTEGDEERAGDGRRGQRERNGQNYKSFIEHIDRLKRFRQEGETAPFESPGPSLLTQMWPSHSGGTVSSSNTGPSLTSIAPSASTAATSDVPLSTSVMSIDSNPSQSFGDETSSSSVLEGNDRITVNIADLGNGMSLLFVTYCPTVLRSR